MDREKKQKDTDGFTERAIMALVTQAAELRENALAIVAVVTALALANGISTKV